MPLDVRPETTLVTPSTMPWVKRFGRKFASVLSWIKTQKYRVKEHPREE